MARCALGDKRYFTGFIRDLTERQQTEARLQELQTELVHISRLTAMGEMASSLAHELNQPLSAIANYLKGSNRLLGEKSDPESLRLKDALDKAGDQAVRAGDIIRRLRDFVSRGETEARVESLSKLVEEAGALALVGAKQQGVHVRFKMDPGADQVLADKVQIQQVVLNLIRNADRGHGGSGLTEARPRSSRPRRLDDDMVEISVADTGPGISPAIADAAVSALRHDQAAGHGRRAVHLAHHRRSARRPHLGRVESRRRRRLPHQASRNQKGGACRCRVTPLSTS